MKSPVAKIVAALAAIIIVTLFLTHSSQKAREDAKKTLKEKYGAEITERAKDGTEDSETLKSQFVVAIDGGDVFDEKTGEIVPNSHKAIQELTDLTELGALLKKAGRVNTVYLNKCDNLESLTGLENLPALEDLNITNCPKLKDTSSIASLTKLQFLSMIDCGKLEKIDGLTGKPDMHILDFSGNTNLKSLPHLPDMQNLEYLFLSRCQRLESANVSGLNALKSLHFEGCRLLRRIEGLEDLSALTDLNVSSCHLLPHLAGLEKLQTLEMFEARNVDVVKLETIAKLKNLQMLRLAGQEGISSLEALSGLKNLQEIYFEAMPDLETLRGFPKSVTQSASFTHCPKLRDLTGIEVGVQVSDMNFSGCVELRDISAIEACKGLTIVQFMGCRALTLEAIQPLTELPDLGVVLLGGTGVAEASIGDLQRKMPKTRFDFSGAR